ncbi:MAG: HAD-IB family phosphatase [Gemmatimonadales bacterium]|nr:HAD-IB family phosphatase [Gemmatimonadales bacterium]
MIRYHAVVFDFDSTLSAIEGVEWIAARVGPAEAAAIAEEVNAAMAGKIPLEAIYAARMTRIRPSAQDLAELGDAYRDNVAPGAHEVIQRLRDAGVVMHVVSGGFREGLLPLALDLGFAKSEVHAVSIHSNPDGSYKGFDTHSPLVTQLGKLDVVASLGLPSPALMVGDGATDAAARPSVDAFAAYTGFVQRDAVVRVADHVVTSFEEIESLVIG